VARWLTILIEWATRFSESSTETPLLGVAYRTSRQRHGCLLHVLDIKIE
jgi:hypothetical protein